MLLTSCVAVTETRLPRRAPGFLYRSRSLAALYLRHFSGLFLQRATLRNEIMCVPPTTVKLACFLLCSSRHPTLRVAVLCANHGPRESAYTWSFPSPVWDPELGTTDSTGRSGCCLCYEY